MRVKALYTDILTKDWDGVLGWKQNQQYETLHLEFKGKDASSTDFNTADRGKLAKAMSGFANSEGGVYVIGVECKDQGKNPDVVQHIKPVPNIQRFRDMVTRSIQNLTDPSLKADVEIIREKGNSNQGVIVIYIPQTDGGPYRANDGPAEIRDRYYLRGPGCTIPMHHSLLATMFGRRPAPQLRLKVFWHCWGQGNRREGNINLRLLNQGRGIAIRPALRFYAPASPLGTFWWEILNPTSTCLKTPYWHAHMMPSNDPLQAHVVLRPTSELVIYPSDEIEIASGTPFSIRGLQWPADLTEVSMKGTIFAVDSQPVNFEFGLKQEGVTELFLPRQDDQDEGVSQTTVSNS